MKQLARLALAISAASCACTALSLAGSAASMALPPAAAAAASAASPASAPSSARGDSRRANFNDGWRFHLGDVPDAQQSAFSDATWTELRLPHDWAIDGPFDAKLNPHTGALPVSGIGWYRKSFTLPSSALHRYVSVEFDGAMANARVWLNGEELGGRPYGYIGFNVDLSAHLRWDGQPNVLAVRVAPEPNASRWYPGAGIYRNVWLEITGPVHVARWGTYVTTPQVGAARATVVVQTQLRNRRDAPVKASIRATILDASGLPVAQGSTAADVAAGSTQTVAATFDVAHPELWDVDRPYRYSLVTEVLEAGAVVDRYVTPFGIRSIAFDRQRGFLLNGRSVKLHGVCLHHDLGALGAAVNRRATERQLQIMKAAGVNAIRTSHNPPSPELLEFADRLGLLVMDEAFDMWRIPKVVNGYSKYYDEWSERDVRDMVQRDRNHPSVILWSIGNEIPEQGSADGWKEARRLTGFFHAEDPTRPTTSAFNNPDDAIRNKLANEVDIPGFNYAPTRYQRILEAHPDWIIYGSETASCVSSRGVYHLPLEKYEKHPSHQVSSYDIIAPPWAYCPDVEFDAQERIPRLLGEFVWTGFDYLGEPTPYFDEAADGRDWPARSSYFGMVDLAGFPKDRYFLYQSEWLKTPMVHVLPYWNWANYEGRPIPVMVYSNAEEVELFLNGKSLGVQKTRTTPVSLPVGRDVSDTLVFQSKYRLLWQVPYQPGVLRAIARNHGAEVARDEMWTAGPAARVRLIADRNVIDADGDDLSFITARIEDADGHLVPTSDALVHFNVTGAGQIEAVDNGNAATVEPFHADQRHAFSGLALLIVRSRAGPGGAIHVTADSAQLSGDSVQLSARPVSAATPP